MSVCGPPRLRPHLRSHRPTWWPDPAERSLAQALLRPPAARGARRGRPVRTDGADLRHTTLVHILQLDPNRGLKWSRTWPPVHSVRRPSMSGCERFLGARPADTAGQYPNLPMSGHWAPVYLCTCLYITNVCRRLSCGLSHCSSRKSDRRIGRGGFARPVGRQRGTERPDRFGMG